MSVQRDAAVGNADALVALGAQLREYFDGIYHSDTQRLRRVFHPQAVYATATRASGPAPTRSTTAATRCRTCRKS